MSTDFRPEGNPLPAKPDHTIDFGRDSGRQFLPTQADFSRDIIGSKASAGDERIRQVERGRVADFWMRRFGRPITENEYPVELRNESGR